MPVAIYIQLLPRPCLVLFAPVMFPLGLPPALSLKSCFPSHILSRICCIVVIYLLMDAYPPLESRDVLSPCLSSAVLGCGPLHYVELHPRAQGKHW
ncbi:hypothetical protein C2E23DRAFT_821194 [Lenzites betulinus]|nr:hypothetical protein C2E23DRAFT_821194 [Lenzites betulinus]